MAVEIVDKGDALKLIVSQETLKAIKAPKEVGNGPGRPATRETINQAWPIDNKSSEPDNDTLACLIRALFTKGSCSMMKTLGLCLTVLAAVAVADVPRTNPGTRRMRKWSLPIRD